MIDEPDEKQFSPQGAFLLKQLRVEYPNPITLLTYSSAFELLIKVMLSAQCSDAQVNKIAGVLFQRYPDAPTLAAASQEDVARIIRPLGYFNTKAGYCIEIAKGVIAYGDVPDNMSALCSLPGIGRKSASVILYTIYKKPALIVDRHVARVSTRLGISTDSANITDVEKQLATITEKESWGELSMLLNYHGRYCCTARGPECTRCPLAPACLYEQRLTTTL